MLNNDTCRSSIFSTVVIGVKVVIRHKCVCMLNYISLCKMCALFDAQAIGRVNWHSFYNIVYMLGL